jgi:hypothetical protein
MPAHSFHDFFHGEPVLFSNNAGPPRFHTMTESLYLLTSTPPCPEKILITNLNLFIDRDLFTQREEQGDSLDQSVYQERMQCREEGREYGILEYW